MGSQSHRQQTHFPLPLIEIDKWLVLINTKEGVPGIGSLKINYPLYAHILIGPVLSTITFSNLPLASH